MDTILIICFLKVEKIVLPNIFVGIVIHLFIFDE